MATRQHGAPAPDPYSYENANDDEVNDFTDDDEDYENMNPDAEVPFDQFRRPGSLNSRAVPPPPNLIAGPPPLPPRREGETSVTTNVAFTSDRPLPATPSNNGRQQMSKNGPRVPPSVPDYDDGDSYETCDETMATRQGRPLPAVPQNVPAASKPGVVRPMPQPIVRPLDKQFSSEDDSYEVCTDVPSLKQTSNAVVNSRGLPPPVPAYDDDDEAEYVQPDDDNKVKPVAKVANKGPLPLLPTESRAQNKVSHSVSALSNRPVAARPPFVMQKKEVNQIQPVVEDDIEYESGEFYTPMEQLPTEKPTKKSNAVVNSRGLPPPVPAYDDDDEAEYVQPDEDSKVKPVAKVANKGPLPLLPTESRAQNKVSHSVSALSNRPVAARPPFVMQKKEVKQMQPVADNVAEYESSECYTPMDQSSIEKSTKMQGFRMPVPAKADKSAGAKNNANVGVSSPAASGLSDVKGKVIGKPAVNNRPVMKDAQPVGIKKSETVASSNSENGINSNVLLNMRSNLKKVSQTTSPKPDPDSTAKKSVPAQKTAEATPVPSTVPQTNKFGKAEAEAGSSQVSKSIATKCPAPPVTGVARKQQQPPPPLPKKIETNVVEPDEIVASRPVDGENSRTTPDEKTAAAKPVGHVVPRMQSSAVASRPALPIPPPAEKIEKKEGLYGFSWYGGDINRKDAEARLRAVCENGAFLIRKSGKEDVNNPYSISVYFNNYIYNLRIRKRADQKFAIGSEKPDEIVFSSVPELVSFYKNNTLEMIGDPRRNIASGKIQLVTKDC